MSELETTQAFRDLVAELSAVEDKLLQSDLDEQTMLEAYKWMFSVMQVGLETFVWGDSARPRFIDIVGQYKKWGGDNADAFYQYAPIDPARTYRVRARPGDAVYFSLTVYGGPDDGHYSTRIVGSANDRDVKPGPDGTIELTLSPEPQPSTWIKLEPDAVCAITRDYLVDPTHGRRMEWEIETEDPPATRRETDADLARRFRAALTWFREQATIAPLPLPDENTVDEPYPVPKVTFGWAAGDAAYASGAFSLQDDQALLIEGRSPACAFWNVCLWNPFLHTYDYAYERVTINGGQVVHEPDGSWRIVVAATDPGHPNWVSTAGHPRGRIWFRWFLPESTPEQPSTRVVPITDVPR